MLLPSCLPYAFRGQSWSPRVRTKQSLPCRFSQSLVCVFLSLEQHDPISAMWARRVLPSCLLHASRGQTWIPRASTNQFLPCRFSQSVVSVFLNPWASKTPSVPCYFSVFLPSWLLHASRGQTWIPRASTNQSLPRLFHFCETGGVSWQLGRFWKLASDKSLG